MLFAQGPPRGSRPGGYGGPRPGGDYGRGGDRGSYGGPRPGDERDSERGDPRPSEDRSGPTGKMNFSDIFTRMDANGDGKLQESETSSRAKEFIGKLRDKFGFKDKELKIDKLIKAAEKYQEGGGSKGDDGDSGDTSKYSTAFGVPDDLELAKGFDSPPPYTGAPLEKKYTKEILEYVDRMILRYDKNKNGALDGFEWKEVKWRTPAEDSDTNHDGRLTRAEICERLAIYYREKDGESKSSSSGDKSSPDKRDEDKEKYTKYAQSMIKQYDTNKNGVIDKSEWAKMKGNPGEHDKNHDGRLDLKEMTARLSGYSKGAPSSSSSRPSSKYSSKSRSSTSREPEKDVVPTYRFKSALERLPEGLPDWFIRNDSNADGQIMMSEYSTSWTSTKVREFQGFDLNGDGVITSKECQKAEELADK
ncbi:MAG: hypothetical protein ACKVH8_00490 [Pirellulales bacterium]